MGLRPYIQVLNLLGVFRVKTMNQPQKAIEYLEKSLELGYDGYSMMLTDLYLDPIRDLPEYKTTVEKCKTKYLAQFEE